MSCVEVLAAIAKGSNAEFENKAFWQLLLAANPEFMNAYKKNVRSQRHAKESLN